MNNKDSWRNRTRDLFGSTLGDTAFLTYPSFTSLSSITPNKAQSFAVVLEALPAVLTQSITRTVSIPTIEIEVGSYRVGQVLVL